jgi:hypothetical protein
VVRLPSDCRVPRSCVSLIVYRELASSLASSCKGINFIHEDSTLMASQRLHLQQIVISYIVFEIVMMAIIFVKGCMQAYYIRTRRQSRI